MRDQPPSQRTSNFKTFPQLSEVSQLFLRTRATIETKWMQRCRVEIKGAAELEHPILMNTLPAFLANIAEALTPGYPRATGAEMSTLASEHGNERARLTSYSPRQIIAEYQILGEVIFAELGRQIRLTSLHRLVIQKSIDEAVRQAIMSYAFVQTELRQQVIGALSQELMMPLHKGYMALQPLKHSQDEVISKTAREVELRLNEALAVARKLSNTIGVTPGERLHLDLSMVNVIEIIADVTALAERQHGKRFKFTGFHPYNCLWDRTAIANALDLSIQTAVKYAKPDTQILIDLVVVHERAVFSIFADGQAIPPKELECIYQVFNRRTSTPTREHNAMAVVRDVTEAHGGSVFVDTAPDRGTTISLDIPIDASPYQHAPISSGVVFSEDN